MKITISKTAKRVLSVTLALVMILGTLFVANSGVTFTASAETEGTVLLWSGERATSFSDDGIGTKEDPIIINTPEELALLAYGANNTTDGKYYKIADGIKAFDMNGLKEITLNSSLDDVNSATTTGKNWHNKTFNQSNDNSVVSYDFHAFSGHFDGNGVIIFNLYDSGNSAGLFPRISCDVNGGDTVIENVIIKNSQFLSPKGRWAYGAGTVFGYNSSGSGDNSSNSTIVSNCHVENCYVFSGTDYSDSDSTLTTLGNIVASGSIAAYIGHERLIIENCLVKNNNVVSEDSRATSGIVATNQSNAPDELKVNNTVVVNSPCQVSNSAFNATVAYTNVYTTENSSESGIKTLTSDQMTGEAATQNMALDFSGTWFANTSGVPVLRAFHTIIADDNGDGTHKGLCSDCGLVGITESHLYNIVDYNTNISSCICGVWEWGTNDVWDGTKASGFAGGTGTEADPYIIKTVEQLFLMVRSTGINDDGTPVYYKVDENVNALYINDTRAFADQAAFEAAASSLNNWSTGLTTEAALCGNTSNCYSEHYNDVYTSSSTKVLNNHRDGYVDYFGGRFDGNGVTIYGLYSMTTAANHWNNGTGFVPMLTGDAVIKNVTFDTNYVKTNSANAAVITATTGIWDGQYNKNTDSGKDNEVFDDYGNPTYETNAMCPKFDAYAKRPENCNAAIINVAVRNSYLNATNYSGTSYVSGFVSSIRAPKSLKFDSCLFDGTNTTITDTASTDKHYAFVVTQESNTNATVTSCASVTGSSTVTGLNSYTDAVNSVVSCNELDSNEFTIDDAPLLNWTAWEIIDNKPTPKVNNSWIADYYRNQGEYKLSWRKNKVLTSTDVYDGSGYEFSALRGNRGVFNDYNTLVGSGTEADPYIINDADTLYMIIASGGTHYGVPQYYKLGCNIDLEGKQWVDTNTFENTTYNVVFYEYQPFAGTIDGDGHTISNLYTVDDADDGIIGFIPELAEGGVVKNINFRNCYSYSGGSAGIIAGDAHARAQIINCSIEDSSFIEYVGYGGTLSGCYTIDADGSQEFTDGETPTLGTEGWYGIEGGIVRPVSFAKAQPCADINADGLGEEYDTSDVTALKNKLLWKDGYDYIYGDVSFNDKIDMRDLAAIQRIITGQETTEYDGFWANVKAGKFTIYYTGDSDNYDFARKLELHLESMTGAEVEKTNTGDSSKYAVKLVTSGDANAWSYTYDVDNAVLTFTGGSFTAVEAAVDHFIQNVTIFDLPQETTGTIDSAKNAITVDGSTYYYAWGDEFNNDVSGTVNYDKWNLRNKGTDDTPGTIDTEFEYIRAATDAEAKEINAVKDGKLSLKRGFTGATATKEHKFYMSGIGTKDSMLFKQGYLEMVAAVPSDGYAFPAWWLLTHESKSNVTLDHSLYSKVYERNGVYNGTSTTATPTDVTSYKYKLPTQTLEMDLFEIIQRPTEKWNLGGWGYVSKPSDDHNIKFNIHKWYTYSLDKNDNSLAVYDLDWSNAPTSGAFPTKLLTASGATAGEGYTQQSSSIKINTGNLSGGSVNGAATYQGGHSEMKYNMASLRTNGQIKERKYGFLWNDNEMTFIVYTDATGTTELYRATVTKNQMNFGSESYSNSNTFGFDQYAYMLIENHIFTAQKDGSSWIQAAYDDIGECDLVIDYVRLYQLDGARAIITPESESIYDR